MRNNILKVLFLGAIVFLAGSVSATSYPAYGNCNFNRDLSQGMRGEDVRCLQKYLASNGFSYGYADGVYGYQTRQAVMRWQQSYGIYPAYGSFDSVSKSKYFELVGYSGGYYGTSGQDQAWQMIEEALIMIEDARDEIDDSNKSNLSAARSELKDAEEDILDAVHEFFVNRDYDEAYDLAKDSLENAEDAYEDAGGRHRSRSTGDDRIDAKNAIEDAEDAIEDAEDEIEDARRRGVSSTLINKAEDHLEDAEEKLEDAEDEYDDGDYEDALDSANDAEDFADDAIDEVN